MNVTKMKTSASLLYMSVMTLPGFYYMITRGGIGLVIAFLHVLLSLVIWGWYFYGVLIRTQDP